MQGTQFGAFTLQHCIGRGATSVVYCAVEAETERTVVVKLLARALAFNAYARAQLLREIEQLAALHHPQIVPILQTGMYREQVYLILPHYTAGSLGQRMNRQWSLAETRELICQLIPPLEAAHAANLVHGRLKPSNILFAEDESPCVSDFGLTQLALANSGSWRSNALSITPYTAPEQRAGMPLNHATDVYALGVLVQQLTGHTDVAQAALAENPAERPTLSTFVSTLAIPPKTKWRNRILTQIANFRR